MFSFFFFFNDTATTEIYTLSLHDALPICITPTWFWLAFADRTLRPVVIRKRWTRGTSHLARSEEHTSELQSPCNLVCRLLLEKKKNNTRQYQDVFTIRCIINSLCTR